MTATGDGLSTESGPVECVCSARSLLLIFCPRGCLVRWASEAGSGGQRGAGHVQPVLAASGEVLVPTGDDFVLQKEGSSPGASGAGEV